MPTEHDPQPSVQPIVSQFADDPDMQEIITMFVQEMPERVEQLQQSWRASEFDLVKRMAHQLKGAGGGYGYPELGNVAGQLENSLNQLAGSTQATNLDTIRKQLDALIEMCNRVA